MNFQFAFVLITRKKSGIIETYGIKVRYQLLNHPFNDFFIRLLSGLKGLILIFCLFFTVENPVLLLLNYSDV
jgi:hypothetical protein